MEYGYLIALFVIGVLVTHFRPAWADFCVRVAGTMVVVGILLQILRALLHF